jgi:hypothetical protein
MDSVSVKLVGLEDTLNSYPGTLHKEVFGALGMDSVSVEVEGLKDTVEVSNTGHIIMFKVILKLFAGTFSPFFLEKKL